MCLILVNTLREAKDLFPSNDLQFFLSKEKPRKIKIIHLLLT